MADPKTYLVVATATGLVTDATVGQPDPTVFPGSDFVPMTDALAAQGVWPGRGWTRQADGSFALPAAPAPTPAALMAYANARRKALAGDGVLVGVQAKVLLVQIASGTYPVPIDATTRGALGDAAFQTTLTDGDKYTIPAWLLPTGAFISLDATAIMTFAKAVASAFQDLFSAQQRAFAAIATGTAKTTADIDAILG